MTFADLALAQSESAMVLTEATASIRARAKTESRKMR